MGPRVCPTCAKMVGLSICVSLWGTRVLTPHRGNQTGDAMRQRTMEKVDTYAFVGVVMATLWFLWWVFTRVT